MLCKDRLSNDSQHRYHVLLAFFNSLIARDSDTAAFLTPAVKKKRKLYSTTPQTSAVSSSNLPDQAEVRSSQGEEVVGGNF